MEVFGTTGEGISQKRIVRLLSSLLCSSASLPIGAEICQGFILGREGEIHTHTHTQNLTLQGMESLVCVFQNLGKWKPVADSYTTCNCEASQEDCPATTQRGTSTFLDSYQRTKMGQLRPFQEVHLDTDPTSAGG